MADGMNTVQFTSVDDARNKLTRDYGRMVEAADTISGEMLAIANSWLGSASAAYYNLYLKFNEGYQQSLEDLNQLSRDLGIALEHHVDREARRTSNMNLA